MTDSRSTPPKRAYFCRKNGCPCADDCPQGCYLLETMDDAEQDEPNFYRDELDKELDDPRRGQAEGINAWKRLL